jgi:hypothetical protein
MAKESASLTQRIGGNRTLVLGIMILMLVLFTVDYYVLPSLGLGVKDREYVVFQVNGRTVSLLASRFQTQFSDWLKFQNGVGMGRGGRSVFLEELMLAELGRESGLTVTDGLLREALRSIPIFHDFSGEYDDKTFVEALANRFGGLSRRGFEDQMRFSLLVDHVRRFYRDANGATDDEEAYRRWKLNFPKIEIAYAWKAVGPIREGMKVEDVKPEEIASYWKDAGVQDRHRLPKRYAFEAAVVLTDAVEDKACLEAREAAKDDPELTLKKDASSDEAYDEWFQNRKYEFVIAEQDAATVDRLRAENADRVKSEDEQRKNDPKAPPPAPGTPGPDVDLSSTPPAQLEEHELYRRYWRFRVEKDLWLRKLVGKVLKEASEGKTSLAQAAAKWSRPGMTVRVHVQEEPIDQYAVEKIPGVGFEGCDLRFALNGYKPEQAGTYHPEVLATTPGRNRLGERGWLAFRVLKVLPNDVPPMETVRDRLAAELLDDRAKDRARSDLEALRKAAEDGRKSLEEAAKEAGYETAAAGPFNAYSWRPPTPKPPAGKAAAPKRPGEKEPWIPPSEWKHPDRRTSYVMSRYAPMRETPVGAFGPVLDDAAGTGAYYLAQVKSRAEPKFEEMTMAQLASARRNLSQERISNLDKELTYGRLRSRFSLRIRDNDGNLAPAPAEDRGE